MKNVQLWNHKENKHMHKRSISRVEKYHPLQIHSSVNIKWTLEKTVEINVFRTLEINQKLAVIWRMFIQEKWLSLN